MKLGKKAFIGILILLSYVGVSEAANPLIMSISEGMKHPGRVAIDTHGNIYVAQTSMNTVSIYDRKGRPVKSLGVDGPVGLAVDSVGKIYIGSKKSIHVYNPDLTLSHTLADGDNEHPNSIAVSRSGRIYAVDGKKHTINVYEPDGRKVMSIGSFGSTNGLLCNPMGVALNDDTHELYVTDQPIVQTSRGLANGARVQVFDMNGSFKRAFGPYSPEQGQIIRPIDIALDRAGRIYLADSALGVVHIMDAGGALIGRLSDPARPAGVAIAVSISRNQLAYVASYSGSRLDVYGLEGHVIMETSPQSLSIEARQFGPNPSDRTIVIANSGSGILNWTASSDQAWLRLSDGSGTVGPQSSTGLNVSINIAGLGPGNYSGNILIKADFGHVDTIPVSLTILPPPILSLSSGWLTFEASRGKNPEPQTVSLVLSNTTSLSWSAISDSAWLNISPSSGNTTASLNISVNSASMAVGSYKGSITISAPGAIGDGSKIHVDLTVSAVSKITVMTNQPGASFSITGPASYTGGGLEWNVEGAPAGEYTIVYNSLEGYRRPAAETKTLAERGEITFSGNYQSWKDIAARKNIITIPGPGPKNKAMVKTFKTDGSPTLLDILAFESGYGGSVASGDIDGDGTAEIIVGSGSGPANQAIVRVFKSDGTKLLEFAPFETYFGVNVAVADLNADGSAEIIVAPAAGPENRSIVKVYAYNKETMAMDPTGIEVDAHGVFYGANIATGDLEGDGLPEIITAPGPGPANPAEVKVWKIDTTKGMGSWTAYEMKKLSFAGNYGLTLASGDVDGDEKDEIILGAGADPKAAAIVRIIRPDGAEIKRFTAFTDYSYGTNVAAADLDGDGKAEVIAAAGPDPGQTGVRSLKDRLRSMKLNKKQLREVLRRNGISSLEYEQTLKVFGADGKLRYAINPYPDPGYGVRAAVGDLGL